MKSVDVKLGEFVFLTVSDLVGSLKCSGKQREPLFASRNTP